MPVTQGPQISTSEVLATALKDRNYDAKEHITIVLPSADSHYFKAYVDIKDRPMEPHYDELTIDPVTGDIVSEGSKFELADFIYRLHYNLNIPAGKYVLGFVTLFFLFALISGIFIHARKFIANFFQYRGDKHKRSQLLDMHNVVGVISLPFTIMYAISGLIFNLVIIYQIAFALTVYQGDGEALLRDAGFKTIAPTWENTPRSTLNIDQLIDKVTGEYGIAPRMLTLYNYGDKSSVIQLRSQDTSELTAAYNIAYSLTDGSVVMKSDSQHPNTLTIGTGVLRKLHYGNYAALDLRFIYFVLGLAVCGLIITGNFLWLEKREKQRQFSQRTLTIARYITMVGSAGIMVAISTAFLTERLMPINWKDRADLLAGVFWITLGASALVYALPKVSQHYRTALAKSLHLCAGLLGLTVIVSIVTLQQSLLSLVKAQSYTVLAVDLSLVIITLLFVKIGHVIQSKAKSTVVESDITPSTVPDNA